MKVEKFTRWVPQRSGSDWWVFSFYSWQSLFVAANSCQLLVLWPQYIGYIGCILISVASMSFSDLHDKLRLKGRSQSPWIGLSIQHITHSPPEKLLVHPYKLVRTLGGLPPALFLKHPTWASGSWRDHWIFAIRWTHSQRKSLFFFFCWGKLAFGTQLIQTSISSKSSADMSVPKHPSNSSQGLPYLVYLSNMFNQIPNWRQNHPKLQGLTPKRSVSCKVLGQLGVIMVELDEWT